MQDTLSPRDRGFLLADGLFETFKVIEGQAEDLDAHLARLARGAALLHIPYEQNKNSIEAKIQALILENHFENQSLSARITLTRGPGQRGLVPDTVSKPTFLITLAPYSPPLNRPLVLSLASDRRNEFSRLSNIKSLSYTENVLGRLEAIEAGADDCVFLNTRGFVACTSCANIFIEKEARLITPPLEDGVLSGITRAKIIASQKTVLEQSLTLQDCLEADRIWVCNSLIGMREARLRLD